MVFRRIDDEMKTRKIKLSRALRQVKLPVSVDGTVSDYGIKHVAEVKAWMANENVTELKARVKQGIDKHFERHKKRELKLGRKV